MSETAKSPYEQAKWSIDQLDGIMNRSREERRRTKEGKGLSEEEIKLQIETINAAERSEIAALFDHLGVISGEEKVRALQKLQGPVKPRRRYRS